MKLISEVEIRMGDHCDLSSAISESEETAHQSFAD
jgi:hypothetical protein